ncbi:MAG: helix-turn-helix domain-containing protein [Nitrospirota bacterium]|nr:helix-turn-helix domain-containing protein [Nitrospirota bacterium]
MRLTDYLKCITAAERRHLAQALGTSVVYLSQLAHGHRKAGPALTLRIERATARRVCRHDLRPDLHPAEECPMLCGPPESRQR